MTIIIDAQTGRVTGNFDEQAPAQKILTHLEWRRRFTPDEQEWADELEVTFESSSLPVDVKRKLRTGYKNFYAASSVDPADPTIPQMLELFTALGGLGKGRSAEILAA